MRARDFIGEVTIDNAAGLGEVPINRNVDYLGLRVLMRPSTFLRLAAPLHEPGSAEHIANHIKQGGAIASPFLDIDLPPSWEDGDLSEPARVLNHEGRNRMMAVRSVDGDDPIEVHLFFRGGIRRRHLTDDMIKRLNQALIPQGSKVAEAPGPYFQLVHK